MVEKFEDLVFHGRKDKQNLMRFIQRFERTADYEGVDDKDRLHYFGKTMRDNAATWFELNEPDSFDEAKEKFLEHFWGEDEQARFRQKMYTSRYHSDKGTTMADYALEYARQAKLLIPPMSETEIIRVIKGHFHIDVSRDTCNDSKQLKGFRKIVNEH
ncbi:hypothetical protein ALC57_00041 [Trachymyrmex cornetzi]|uniref:Ty3 transposon capsid-like protein domain-containing protein n=1 Tax=Trachymyrmex cornetzi TaxID=471704 RepID=A0A151K2P6_9HYME|nr:hypothetical protein ALC57_00041 [Trachymyrmex cornetzi]